jgi:hypothetical protein
VEELAIGLLQFLLEFGLQLLIYLGLDIATVRDEETGRPGCLLVVIFLIFGGLLAALTTWIHPKPFLPEGFRLMNLIVAPFVAGGISWLIARWRHPDGPNARLHCYLAFVFVLSFNLVRFAFARA